MRARSERHRPIARLFALVFLIVIGADLADAQCDPVPSGGGTVTVSASMPGDCSDPCLNQCMPDCFCCSRTVAGPLIVLPSTSGPSTMTAVLTLEADVEGVQRVPYRPPLPIA